MCLDGGLLVETLQTRQAKRTELLNWRSGIRGRTGFSSQFVGLGLFLRPKRSEEQHAVPLHIAGPRVAGAAIAADLFAGLVTLDMTTIGAAKADLTRLGDLDPLEQTLVRLALGHFGTGGTEVEA